MQAMILCRLIDHNWDRRDHWVKEPLPSGKIIVQTVTEIRECKRCGKYEEEEWFNWHDELDKLTEQRITESWDKFGSK